MKKIFIVGISMLFVSCSQEEFIDAEKIETFDVTNNEINALTDDLSNDQSKKANVSSANQGLNYLFNNSTEIPVCGEVSGANVAQTYDVEIVFSEPIPYHGFLNFSLQTFKKISSTGRKYDFQSVVSPFVNVPVSPGMTKLILEVSCELTSNIYISCSPEDRGVKTKNFRITLENGSFIRPNLPPLDFNYTSSNGKNYFDTKSKINCFGNGGGPKDPKLPGGF